MSIEKFRREIDREKERMFTNAQFFILEDLPFYLKIRIVLDGETFMEVRMNSRNGRESFVLVRRNKRIAGFDNLGGWHLHPCGNANTHRKINRPSVRFAFEYLADCYQK